jgi:hypothetical protein
MAGSSFRAIAPRPDATALQRPFPAVHVADLRAVEESPQRASLVRPGRLARWLEHLIAWYQGFADRRLLASLDDRQRRNLGIDRSAVGGDSTRSYWRLRERNAAPAKRR